MNKRKKNIEILAPAGSYAAFSAALCAGADAVYAGGQRFGARAFAENFTQEEMIRAIREAHLFGRKFYLTVNTLLKDDEISELYDYLAPFYENGLDAVIVQDMGVLEFVRTHFPGMDIHASTQMTITGEHGAAFLESQGASRVVLARELSLEEIRQIHERTGVEIECFVHGALCYCYSGQCLMSSMIGGRSGNRGQCAQPCRLPYEINGEKRYFLSPKDICTLEIIPDLVEAGIDSFKIEGRMKKPEYVAGVTAMYRKYTDLYLKKGRQGFTVDPADREELMDLYNRGGSSSGYYREHNGKDMMALDRPNHAGVPAVRVKFQKGREIHGTVLTDLNAGDVIEITGGKNNYTLGAPLKKGSNVSFLTAKNVHVSSETVLNRIRNESLISRLRRSYEEQPLQRPVNGLLTLYADSPGTLTVWAQGMDGRTAEFTAVTEEPVQRAQNRPVDEDRVRAQMERTGNSNLTFCSLDIEMEEGIFVPVQQLNQLRRNALEGLESVLKDSCCRTSVKCSSKEDESGFADVSEHPERFSVLAETKEQLDGIYEYLTRSAGGAAETGTDTAENRINLSHLYAEMEILTECDGRQETVALLKKISETGCTVIPAFPRIFRTGAEQYGTILEELEQVLPVGGVLIRNCEAFEFLRSRGFDKTIILDHNLYVLNQYAKAFWKKAGVTDLTAPLELNCRELEQLGLRQCELIVYGRIPVMLSAQCVQKTAGQCKRQPGLMALTDRLGHEYPVRRHCGLCYNVIYSDQPVYLGEEWEDIARLAPRMLRIQFSTEGKGEVLRVFRQISRDRKNADLSEADESGAVPDSRGFAYTPGHFRRGIR